MLEMFNAKNYFDYSKTLAAPLFDGIEYPWEVLPRLESFILALGPMLPADEFEQVSDNVWISRSAVVAPTASITGPCIVDSGAQIRHCAFIRGNVIVGKGTVVGNSCEVKNSLLFDEVEAPHFNYVGDSESGEEFAWNVLDAIVNNYYEFYAGKYVEQPLQNNGVSVLSEGSYDYLESAQEVQELQIFRLGNAGLFIGQKRFPSRFPVGGNGIYIQ